jgi:hypothetical protein
VMSGGGEQIYTEHCSNQSSRRRLCKSRGSSFAWEAFTCATRRNRFPPPFVHQSQAGFTLLDIIKHVGRSSEGIHSGAVQKSCTQLCRLLVSPSILTPTSERRNRAQKVSITVHAFAMTFSDPLLVTVFLLQLSTKIN